MTRDQKAVSIGASSGVAVMLVLVWWLSREIALPSIADTRVERIAYALRWATVPAILLFVLYAAVGNWRFFSEAIDPTLGKESQKILIDGRVADNSTQQFLLFFVGLLALSVTLPFHRLSIVPAVSITFVIVRIAFWVGYRIKPIYRAFGFASTAYMNLLMLVGSLWLWTR